MVLALLTIYKAQKQWNDQNGKAACYVTRVKMFLSTAWRRKKQHNKPTHWLFGASEFKWAGFHEIKVEKNKQNKNQEVLNTACCVCNNKGREREERQLLSEYKKKQLGTPKLGNKLEKKAFMEKHQERKIWRKAWYTKREGSNGQMAERTHKLHTVHHHVWY